MDKEFLLEFSKLADSEKVDFISALLQSKNTDVKATGLSLIDEKSAVSLKDKLFELAYHYTPEVRASALYALRFIATSEITEIIKDSLTDRDVNVLKVASMLFHRDEKGALAFTEKVAA